MSDRNYERMRQEFLDECAKRRKLQAENKQLRELLVDANGLLRSAHEVAKRKGAETHWRSFKYRVKNILAEQHRFMNGAGHGK